ncbi:hypothetical protein QOZ80_4BG0338740 [Eleusine coracana subsp. coracana]|nr:hypothetical protein QOZ80_4BG0338740 [Eleusine coracana subsp. coracana]
MAGESPATGQAGASPNSPKRKATPPSPAAAADDEGEAEEEDREELERELAELDRRVLEKRHHYARLCLDAVASHLDALRPTACLDDLTVSESSVAEDDKEKLEKLKVIKSKHEANAAALQKVLERVNESIAQSERFKNLNVKS